MSGPPIVGSLVSGLNVYIKFSDNKVRVSLVLNKAFLARPKTLYSNDPSGLYWRHRTVSSKMGSSPLISSLNSSLVNFSSFHFELEFQKKVGESYVCNTKGVLDTTYPTHLRNTYFVDFLLE